MNRFLFILCFSVNLLWGQQVDYVDFKTAKVNVYFGDLKERDIHGSVLYKFDVLKAIDSVVIDAQSFGSIEYILDNEFSGDLYNGKQLIVRHDFKAKSTHTLEIRWKASPKKAMYFLGWDHENVVASSDSDEDQNNIYKKQIWTQGQGKYTSNWLPSFDDMNEKIEFDLSINFHKDFEVIASGKLVNKQVNDSTITWHYNMEHPMSSYLVALAIGKYDKKITHSKSRIPLENYYYPEDSLKVEPTYRYTKEIFDFFEDEIGFSYPWQNYKQVPVKDFLYAGMENTSATIFSDAFVIDSTAFIDKNYVNVNAHELAHQWFGDLVTETSGTHHWLQEGFATYYALLAEREVFGDDYYYYKLFEYLQELKMQDEAGASTGLLNPKSSSTTFYKKGAWVLTILRARVGDKAFKKAIKNYLKKYQFKNVETADFIKEVEKSSGENLTEFVQIWLESDILHDDELELFLSKNAKDYTLLFELNCEDSIQDCLNYIETTQNNYLKAEVINRLQGDFPIRFYDTKAIKVRQALAQSVYDIPFEQKANYESLLTDKSYLTIETALFNLWRNFPLERKRYLNITHGIEGFNDKNVHILWLTLAYITEDYNVIHKKRYISELTNYTSPQYSFEIRQNAFMYLNQIQACSTTCKEHLKEATTHHNWRFQKFAKDLLKL